MKKYRVLKECSRGTFSATPAKAGKPPLILDAADLKTAEGEPLPPDVVAFLVRTKCLVEETEDAEATAKATGKAKKGEKGEKGEGPK